MALAWHHSKFERLLEIGKNQGSPSPGGGGCISGHHREAFRHRSLNITVAAASYVEIQDDGKSQPCLVSETQLTFDPKVTGDFDGVESSSQCSRVLDSTSVTGLLRANADVGDCIEGSCTNHSLEAAWWRRKQKCGSLVENQTTDCGWR